MKCPHCGYRTMLTLPSAPPIIDCTACHVAELDIISVEVSDGADGSDCVRLFHFINEQRSNNHERRAERFACALGSEAYCIWQQPAE
jgi:hypothetical protein